MCSNFETVVALRMVQEHFGLSTVPDRYLKKENIRPTDEVWAIGPQKEVGTLQWGFSVDWSKQPLINARLETLLQKQTFADCVEKRCVVPATCWFEWRNAEGKKFKNRIALADTDLMGFGAIWREGKLCLLTKQAEDQVCKVHHRMPVIIPPAMVEAWCDPSLGTRRFVEPLLNEKGRPFSIEEERPKNEQFSLF